MQNYAELICKTNFSFLRGASHPQEMIHEAAAQNLHGIAITDHNGVYGMPKAYWTKKHSYPDLKLIVGSQMSLENYPELILLAQNRQAYGLLCRIITACHQDKPKGEPQLKLNDFIGLMERPGSQGLLALYNIQHHARPAKKSASLQSTIHSRVRFMQDLFKDRIYLPLSRLQDGNDEIKNHFIQELSQEHQINIVATNEAHYHQQDRRPLQDTVTAIREGKSLGDTGFNLFSNSERHIKSPDEMIRIFKDLPEAIEQTVQIADSCTFCPSELRYYYPSEWIPKEHSAQTYLEELTWSGAQNRYPDNIPPKVRRLIIHELSLIKQLQFADYFLTIYEIVDFARSQKILCQGRGSAANSVVCYCLGITAVDPSQMDLLFERFISAERNEPPDIDVDFEHERREEVIQHVYEKYGRDRAGMVAAIVTYRGRNAFREVSKALGVKVGTLASKKVRKHFNELSKDTGIEDCENLAETLTDEMKGFPRHLSIHSGGFTLSAQPIIEIVPIEPARMENRTIIQWDKEDLDYLGLIKVDLLSLGMLSAIRKNLDLIGMQLHEIPHGDKPTYQMIQKADTVGTFQIESRAQMSMLGRLLPANFYDLVVEVAIVRPGPIVGKMVHPYLKRRRGEEQVTYPHPKLKNILDKTLGVPLFQEQVMRIAIELGGFTPGEADELRRAIGAWRSSSSIRKMGEKLVQGLINNGLPEEFARRVYDQIKGFAEYGFPESHAASFALLAYASCFLKCHYPAEFAASLINSQPMGFYSVHTLIDDAKLHGVKVLPVDPNRSDWDCTIEYSGSQNSDKKLHFNPSVPPGINNRALRLGWRVIKGISKDAALAAIEEGKREPFNSIGDFLKRTSIRMDVLHRMAMGNMFEGFGKDQRHTLWQVLSYQIQNEGDQLRFFNKKHSFIKPRQMQQKLFEDLSEYDRIYEDYEAFGLSAHAHPMKAVRKMIKLPPLTTRLAREQPNGRWITTSGLILIRQRPGTANGMNFSTLEDETGFLDLAMFPDTAKKYAETYLNHCFLKVSGILQRDTHSTSLLIKKMEPFWNEPKTSADSNQKVLFIDPTQYFW